MHIKEQATVNCYSMFYSFYINAFLSTISVTARNLVVILFTSDSNCWIRKVSGKDDFLAGNIRKISSSSNWDGKSYHCCNSSLFI